MKKRNIFITVIGISAVSGLALAAYKFCKGRAEENKNTYIYDDDFDDDDDFEFGYDEVDDGCVAPAKRE